VQGLQPVQSLKEQVPQEAGEAAGSHPPFAAAAASPQRRHVPQAAPHQETPTRSGWIPIVTSPPSVRFTLEADGS
jgi:hypothetical protein